LSKEGPALLGFISRYIKCSKKISAVNVVVAGYRILWPGVINNVGDVAVVVVVIVEDMGDVTALSLCGSTRLRWVKPGRDWVQTKSWHVFDLVREMEWGLEAVCG
jgi:hypothetical protein